MPPTMQPGGLFFKGTPLQLNLTPTFEGMRDDFWNRGTL